MLRHRRPPRRRARSSCPRRATRAASPLALRDRRLRPVRGSTTTIEDAGHDLGMIYHSHTRSDPMPSQTDINLASPSAGRAVPDRRRRGPGADDVRAWRIVTARSPRRARGRGGLTWPRRSCARAAARAADRERAVLPALRLAVRARAGRRRPRVAARGRGARARAQDPPALRRGRAVRVARRSNQPEAELLQALLLEAGHAVARAPLRRLRRARLPRRRPARRARARGGEAAAREVLGTRPAPAVGAHAGAGWVRMLALVLAALVIALVCRGGLRDPS